MILKIAEQEVLRLSEKNRVVAHVTVGNLREHLRPYRGVRCLVLGYPLRLDTDHHAHALHRRVPPIVCLNSASCWPALCRDPTRLEARAAEASAIVFS